MASPRVLEKPHPPVQDRPGDAAALRLLSAERTEEIFPILLEEIVKLGFPRAVVLEVDFDNSEVKATASLNFDRNELEKFHTSLWARENPIVAALQRLNPGVLPAPPGKGAILLRVSHDLSQSYALLGSRARTPRRLSGGSECAALSPLAARGSDLQRLRYARLCHHCFWPNSAEIQVLPAWSSSATSRNAPMATWPACSRSSTTSTACAIWKSPSRA